ncbi:MAG TPA: hypothetical protein VIH86_05175 [Puia sp.]
MIADIVNDRDSVINQIILNNGSFKLDGRINLPVDLPEGNYWLRTYTRRQLREDPFEIYVQPLFIFNVDKRVTIR